MQKVEKISIAYFYETHEQTINTLVKMGIIPCQIKRDYQIFKLFKDLESKYPSRMDRYVFIAEELTIGERTVRRAIDNMEECCDFID